jgi:hypothetical protein
MDARGIHVSVMDVRDEGTTDQIRRIMRAGVSSKGGDLIIGISCGPTVTSALNMLLRENPFLRSNIILVNDVSEMGVIVEEYAARYERYGKMEILFLVGGYAIPLAWMSNHIGKFVDGDLIVTWPTGENFWITGDYSPFINREAMIAIQLEELEAYLSENIMDKVLFNPGVDMIELDMQKYGHPTKTTNVFQGVCVVPKGVLDRNLTSRAVKQRADKMSQWGDKKAHPQPVDIEGAAQLQEEYVQLTHTAELMLFHGFSDIPLTLNGVVAATYGSGKSTFVKNANDFNCLRFSEVFSFVCTQAFGAAHVAKSSTDGFSVGGDRPPMTGIEHVEQFRSLQHSWVGLLEEASRCEVGRSQTQQRSWWELVKKAGTANVWICEDKALIDYEPVLKDIDPLKVMIGKVTNRLVAFTPERVEKVPEDFAQMFFYAMVGAGPWDSKQSVWNGVVPQMINVTAGVWNGNIWSTSPFGMLYNTNLFVQSVVPLFPELMTGDRMLWMAQGVVTELDAELSYAFKASDGTLRQYEWVFDVESHVAGSGSVMILGDHRDSNHRIYDVLLTGEVYSSKHDPRPHVTFDQTVKIQPNTTIPITKIVTRDGTRIGHVKINGIEGHITLGALEPHFAGDAMPLFEASESCKGKRVSIRHSSEIRDTDIVFRCGELCDDALFLYMQMVNRAIMGTGKIPTRLDYKDAIEKARLRINEGIDRSGHVALAANVPPLQRNVFMTSVALNMVGAYDARGIYRWSGLPAGRWHTLDDYRSAVEFGLSRRNAPPREASFLVFRDFFAKLGAVEGLEASVSARDPLLYQAHHVLGRLYGV